MKLTVQNYQQDPYYPKVVSAMDTLLEQQNYVAPIEVFKAMGLLTGKDVVKWRQGAIPYLERVITCNLKKASRILRLMGFHAHDLNLKPSSTVYKGKRGFLRFTKTSDPKLESVYARHFVSTRKLG